MRSHFYIGTPQEMIYFRDNCGYKPCKDIMKAGLHEGKQVKHPFSWRHMSYRLKLLSVSVSPKYQYKGCSTRPEVVSGATKYLKMVALI